MYIKHCIDQSNHNEHWINMEQNVLNHFGKEKAVKQTKIGQIYE